MADKGLGMGLGALFGADALEEPERDFEFLPIARIEPRTGQPRTVFDEQALSELAESLREHGVIQPLTVRRLKDGYFQIIAGERRWRAARIAGLSEVPARIIEADDRKTMELALVENLQREDLSPIEEAAGYRALMSEYGLTQEQVAVSVGKSRPAIANSLRLLGLPDEVLAMLERGEIVAGAARALLVLGDGGSITAAAQTVAENGLSARETERLVKRLLARRDAPVPTPQKGIVVDYVAQVEQRLTASLGRRVKIQHGRKKGRIEIEYYDQDDFELLSEQLAALRGKKETIK